MFMSIQTPLQTLFKPLQTVCETYVQTMFNPLQTPCKPPTNRGFKPPANPLQTVCKPPSHTHPPYPPIYKTPPLGRGALMNITKRDNILAQLRALGFEATWHDTQPREVNGISADYADLSDVEFERMLRKVHSLDDLAGIANRRKILRAPWLKRYTDTQRQLIVARKLELENNRKAKR